MLKKLSKSRLSVVVSACIAICASSTFSVHAENISFQQMTDDITYLASDELKGRASFSPEIDKAANYISERFSSIGLVPMNNLKTFKQTFAVTSIIPNSLSVSLNNKAVPDADVSMASTMTKFEWTDSASVKTTVIGKDDNMRDVLRKLNGEGGQHLVLISKAHEKRFKGYQGYFASGLTKLSLEHQGAIVMVLTDTTEVKSLEITGTTTIAKKQLTNVVGVLPGKQKANELVLYSAHYDHLGLNKDGTAVFNGADDDASGTAAVINLAEHFARKGNNNRTLVFSAFTAEEIGGFGSQYFSKQLNPDDVVAMINIEMIGKPSKFGAGSVWMTGMERSNLGALLNEKLNDKSLEIHQDPYPEQGLFYRSDNATLARLGVPAHSFSSTQLDKDQHYHKTTDDLASLDLKSMHQVIESLSVATESLVDGSTTPTRVDVAKVRARGKIY